MPKLEILRKTRGWKTNVFFNLFWIYFQVALTFWLLVVLFLISFAEFSGNLGGSEMSHLAADGFRHVSSRSVAVFVTISSWLLATFCTRLPLRVAVYFLWVFGQPWGLANVAPKHVYSCSHGVVPSRRHRCVFTRADRNHDRPSLPYVSRSRMVPSTVVPAKPS